MKVGPRTLKHYSGVRYDSEGEPLNDLERIMHSLEELKEMVRIVSGMTQREAS